MANTSYIEEEVFQLKDKTFDFGVLENQKDKHYEPVCFSDTNEMKEYYKDYKYIGSYNIYNYMYQRDVKTITNSNNFFRRNGWLFICI